MMLTIATPLAIVVEEQDIAAFRAEDDTGSFGILPGHADFITALSVSVAAWSDAKGVRHYVALRGGLLEVRDGRTIAVATREALRGEDLNLLETEVIDRFHRQEAEERIARTDAQRLYLAAIRQIYRALRRDVSPTIPGIHTPESELEAAP